MSEEKKGFFSRLKEGLTKTRNNIVHGIDSVFSGFSNIDDDFFQFLIEIIINFREIERAGKGEPYQRTCGMQGIPDPQY